MGLAEEVLLEAVKLTLRVMSAVPRYAVLTLRTLTRSGGSVSWEDLEEECRRLGFKCTKLREGLRFLEDMGAVEVRGGVVYLTEDGRELANTLYDIEVEALDFASTVAEGNLTESDLYAYLLTPAASAAGLAAAVAGDASSLRYFLPLHAYVTLLPTLVLVVLSARDPTVAEMIETLVGARTSGLGEERGGEGG